MTEPQMEATNPAPTAAPGDRWAGGVSPFGMTWQKFMMWWFIVGDALLFAGFLASYGFSRLGTASWPDRAAIFNLTFLTVMTFTLISSSATMASAVAAARAGDRQRLMRFLFLTVLGGVAFLAMQGFEWAHFIGDGWRPGHGPDGAVSTLPGYFFLITGFHGTHVLLGVVILSITLFRSMGDRFTADGVELAGLYWHFVDLVWVFIFGCFYLI